jgi:copper chaperone CopZ
METNLMESSITSGSSVGETVMPQDVSRDQFALIKIEGMHCHKCELAITRALSQFVGVHEVEVDFASGQASVLFNKRTVSISQMMEAVNEAGYRATGFSQGESNS